MAESKTTFEAKCSILSEVWLDYRKDDQFQDFIEYNDIGLPLGFFISENLVKPSDLAKSMIEESFDLLLASLDREDEGFETLDDVFVG